MVHEWIGGPGRPPRDPKRIPEVLEALRRVWELHPDLRLGQILVIATKPTSPCPEVFHAEEGTLLKGLEELALQVPERQATEQVLIPPQEEVVVDEFHAHEALDRTSLICDLIESHLISHPWFQAHPEVMAKVESAQAILGEVYCRDIGMRD